MYSVMEPRRARAIEPLGCVCFFVYVIDIGSIGFTQVLPRSSPDGGAVRVLPPRSSPGGHSRGCSGAGYTQVLPRSSWGVPVYTRQQPLAMMPTSSSSTFPQPFISLFSPAPFCLPKGFSSLSHHHHTPAYDIPFSAKSLRHTKSYRTHARMHTHTHTNAQPHAHTHTHTHTTTHTPHALYAAELASGQQVSCPPEVTT